MSIRHFLVFVVSCCVVLLLSPWLPPAAAKDEPEKPAKVYVPYEKLKEIFEIEQQGVFLPYEDFQRLWQQARGKPKDISQAPFDYLISIARFTGSVKDDLAELHLELTFDILADGWVHIPLGLDYVGVAKAEFTQPQQPPVKPLLRVVNSRYVLTAKGKGRYVLDLDFVSRLETRPGRNVLTCQTPQAAVATLDMLIAEENLKVDVKPLLAATTSQVDADDKKATRLQAFLGSAKEVRLSWKPKTEAAPELKPVVICEQFHNIQIEEALVNYNVRLDYTIRRGSVDSFTIRLPAALRVTDVSAANIAGWDIKKADTSLQTQTDQTLTVKLFAPVTDKLTLEIKMERFLQEAKTRISLVPIVTAQTLRQTGLIAITSTRRRLYSLKDIDNLARVDTGRLPEQLRNSPQVTAYRFIAADYTAGLEIVTAKPRIRVNQYFTLGVDTDRLTLQARLEYKVERTGIFELSMKLPEPWKIKSLGPDNLVDDYQLKQDGEERLLNILLKSENAGDITLNLTAEADRLAPQADINFTLPLPDEENLQLHRGQLVLLLSDRLRAEIKELRQFQPMPLRQATHAAESRGLSAAMAFEFPAIDRNKPADVQFKIALKPSQVSAVVYRLVDIQRGAIRDEALINYRVRYAPVDTFYLKMPVELADAGARITGDNIKEKPRIDQLPPDQQEQNQKTGTDIRWAYYKVVLQSEVTGSYQLRVHLRETFQAGQIGRSTNVNVLPIVAAGKLSDQNGYIAIAKADTLAVGEPVIEGLTAADPGSEADLPYAPHRKEAAVAFKHDRPYFQLSFPVITQAEAPVFTTIATAAVVEQVIATDGTLNTHAIFLIQTAKGDRLPITLPKNAQLTAVLLNADEAPVEIGAAEEQRIVRLPPSAGRISRFVLEISYGLKNASAANLTAPTLPAEIPVQQTLWRLCIPSQYYLLAHNRIFAQINRHQSGNMFQNLSRRQPSRIGFTLTPQGKDLYFMRQGPPGKLSVVVARKEAFSIAVWAVVIVAGALMLRLSGFQRVMLLLNIALIVALLNLFLPIFIPLLLKTAMVPAILVCILWLAQWLFIRLPNVREAIRAEARPAPQTTTSQNQSQTESGKE